MNRGDKNWAHFQKIKYFKNQNFQKHFTKSLSPSLVFYKEFFFGKIQSFFNNEKVLKNDFENQNLEMFEEVVHNFGKSDGNVVQ